MNDDQKRLLERGVIVLPQYIDHDTYALLVEALVVERPGDPVQLYCRGDGGSANTALALMDLIEAHGSVTGVLHGAALSAHGMVWAACQQRYVAPRGSLGIHKVRFDDLGGVDSTHAELIIAEQRAIEWAGAALLGRISSTPAQRWYTLMQQIGSLGCKLLPAETLIRLGMAHPLTSLVKSAMAAGEVAPTWARGA